MSDLKSLRQALSALPEPDCDVGLSAEKLKRHLGDWYEVFLRWMQGQTFAKCNSDRCSHETPSKVYYCADVLAFVAGIGHNIDVEQELRD